jgi:methylglutaconyl-CoA hydratase
MTAPSATSLSSVLEVASFGGDASRLRDALDALTGTPARVVTLALPESWPVDARFRRDELRWLELFALPTVTAFEGHLEGPALDLALACDIRVCGEGASAKARSIGSRRLLALVGPVVSVDLLRQRGALDAKTMFDTGLVSDLAPAGAALEAASGIAGTIGSRGPIATRLAKEAIWRGLELPLPQALRFETDLTLLLQTTKDRAEGVEAFLDKRPPRFTGE